MVVNFIGGGNRSTRRKPPIGRKSLSRDGTHNISGDRNTEILLKVVLNTIYQPKRKFTVHKSKTNWSHIIN
jgi:hypothetical protein